MKRWLLAILSAISLVLLPLAAVFWARCISEGDYLEYRRPPRLFEVISGRGVLCVAWGHAPPSEYNRDKGWQVGRLDAD